MTRARAGVYLALSVGAGLVALPGCRCSEDPPPPRGAKGGPRPVGSTPLRARLGTRAAGPATSGTAPLSSAAASAAGERLAPAVPATCQTDDCRLSACTTECTRWVGGLPPGALPSPRAVQDGRFTCIGGCLVASRAAVPSASGSAAAPTPR